MHSSRMRTTHLLTDRGVPNGTPFTEPPLSLHETQPFMAPPFYRNPLQGTPFMEPPC